MAKHAAELYPESKLISSSSSVSLNHDLPQVEQPPRAAILGGARKRS